MNSMQWELLALLVPFTRPAAAAQYAKPSRVIAKTPRSSIVGQYSGFASFANDFTKCSPIHAATSPGSADDGQGPSESPGGAPMLTGRVLGAVAPGRVTLSVRPLAERAPQHLRGGP